MVAAGLVGLVVSIAVLRDQPAGVRVAVAAHDIGAGEVIEAADLRTERVQVPPSVLATLVTAEQLRSMRGRVSSAAVPAGDLVARGSLKRHAAPDGLRAMSVPIDSSRAVAGRIEAGDRVDVLFAGEREASIIIGDAVGARRRPTCSRRNRRNVEPLHNHVGGRRAAVTAPRSSHCRRIGVDRAHDGRHAVEGDAALVLGTRVMSEPTIALVFSPEPWVERLHRHLSDHGGARVRQIVLDPALALEDSYDVLVVSHRWPGLTPAFVATVRARGRSVLGVFDPDEPAGREHLVALGVDAVIACDAPIIDVVEMLSGIAAPLGVETTAPDGARLSGPFARRAADGSTTARVSPVVITGLAGAGISEVTLAFACATGRRRRTVLIDATDDSPSLAPRLGLGLEPSLRSAVDAVEHRMGGLDGVLVPVAPGLQVIAGFPSTAGASQVLPGEVVGVIDAVKAMNRVTVVEVGSAGGEIGRAVMQAASSVVFVLPASPIGVARTLAWAARVRPSIDEVPVHLVLNRAPRNGFAAPS